MPRAPTSRSWTWAASALSAASGCTAWTTCWLSSTSAPWTTTIRCWKRMELQIGSRCAFCSVLFCSTFFFFGLCY
jgi:hypothetical protein